MDKVAVLKEVDQIFKKVIGEDTLEILEASSADTVEGWDSLHHILLVVEIEKHFKIRFTTTELNGFKNVGEMCQRITELI